MIASAGGELQRLLASPAFHGAPGNENKRAHLLHAIQQVAVSGL